MSTPTGDGSHAARQPTQVGDDTPSLIDRPDHQSGPDHHPGPGPGSDHHGDREAGRAQRQAPVLDRESVVEREKDAHGGVNFHREVDRTGLGR